MRRAPADLTPKEFRDLLIDNGFAYLGRGVDKYVDIRHRRSGTLNPVISGKRTNRRATFDALLAARRKVELVRDAEIAARQRTEAIAAEIAPHVLPPCRADLADSAAIAQLADDFILVTTTSEGAGWSDLIQKGWRADQLKTYGDAARIVADRRQCMVTA